MINDYSITVQKYGGSSVANPNKIKAVAQYIKECLSPQGKICVVVSAMGSTTNELIKLAYLVSSNPPLREFDMLISCGERSAMALLAMALNDIGIDAISLTGSQSGIITDNNHSGAEIKEIRPTRVLEALIKHPVVIVAGFQGVSYDKEITTLRRGGSDTTAVAMAAALKASCLEIYTDVDGVMDADPNIIKNARLLPKISFDQMEAMTLYGARVLSHDAIRLAKKWQVNLRIAKTGQANKGSEIAKNFETEKENVLAITHLRGIMELCWPLHEKSPITRQDEYFLCGRMKDNNFLAYASNDLSQELIDKTLITRHGLALITLHLSHNQAAYATLLAIKNLTSSSSLGLFDIIVGHSEIFLVVSDESLSQFLELLYAAVHKENC